MRVTGRLNRGHVTFLVIVSTPEPSAGSGLFRPEPHSTDLPAVASEILSRSPNQSLVLDFSMLDPLGSKLNGFDFTDLRRFVEIMKGAGIQPRLCTVAAKHQAQLEQRMKDEFKIYATSEEATKNVDKPVAAK